MTMNTGVGLGMPQEGLVTQVIDTAYHLHRELGQGLLESVYETLLCYSLGSLGLGVERQKPISLHYRQIEIPDAFRVDLLVEGQLVIELKSAESLAPVHYKQLLTYLRVLHLPLGLLINFGAPLLKEGLRRVINQRPNSPA